MKTLLFLTLLTGSLAAIDLIPSFFQQRSTGLKRQSAQQCTKFACGSLGSTCGNDELCNSCTDAFDDCRNSAQGNRTQICDCYIARTACYNSIGQVCGERANDDREDCFDDFRNNPGANCTCGPVSSVLATTNACPFPNTGCSTASRCVARKTSGPCAGPADDSICGDPNQSNLFSSNDYSCQNTSGTFQCALQPGDLSAANDFCSTSAECADGIPCTGGRCQGKGPGANCTTDRACAFGYYCAYGNNNARSCTAYLGAGASCSNGGRCANDYSCGDRLVCVADYSAPVGGRCESGSQCVFGSYCSEGAQGTRTCKAYPASTVCTTDQDCDGGAGSCDCNRGDGTKRCMYGVPDSCSEIVQNVLSCLKDNQCYGDFGGPNTCGARLCANELRCYTGCLLDYLSPTLKSCYTSDLTCDSAGVHLVVGWVLAAFLILAL